MRPVLLLSLIALGVRAEEEKERPALMQRLVQSLPQIPEVIKGQMQGKPDELKKLISNMLGDGLLSQLVVNPMGVAENMGVPLNELGINKTEVEKMSSNMLKGENNGSTPAPFNLFGGFTPSTTTTKKAMYVDGVLIEDFDDFIRRHDLESKGLSTSKPPVTTTPLSTERIAEVIMEKLNKKETIRDVPRPMPQNDLANRLDMNLIDPGRIAEINSVLRRAPPRYEAMDSLALGMDVPTHSMPGPPGFIQSLDPTVDEVVTSLRTKGAYGLTVEDVKRLQNMLQTYEQTLQTKELLTKRKQLQVLQNELTEQRQRIEVQRKMEEELRKKEKELENEHQRMEVQLREQLNSWHSSFNPTQARGPIAPPLNLDSLDPVSGMGHPPASEELPIVSQGSSLHVAPRAQRPEALSESSHERRLSEEREKIVESQMSEAAPQPIKISSALKNQIRYSPRQNSEVVPPSTSVVREDDEFKSGCNCEEISLEKMRGDWALALASPKVVEALNGKASELVGADSSLTCSRFEVAGGKQSVAAQDARLQWQFKVKGSSKINQLRGNALTMDHKSVRVQMRDFDGENFSFPFCALRTDNGDKYEYMVLTNSKGDCKDIALLVRNPEEFFESENKSLAKFLKTKIAKKEINAPEVADFSNKCDE
ncbi:unnamed protein product [Caenorhabditis auriculariae]|uniref:Uncharacterized protein n=1 Tax=Caenorhabditis auriculariae TaxID=2777116 RepID=A0A8S1GVR0_9PELO|nr:unnamed protein product [Caenorhabditis auriculariae]